MRSQELPAEEPKEEAVAEAEACEQEMQGDAPLSEGPAVEADAAAGGREDGKQVEEPPAEELKAEAEAARSKTDAPANRPCWRWQRPHCYMYNWGPPRSYPIRC